MAGFRRMGPELSTFPNIQVFLLKVKYMEGEIEMQEIATEERKMTDEQCVAWIAENQKLYAEGKLAAWKIKRLEAIPGWTWNRSQNA
jgi:hypothetical protein